MKKQNLQLNTVNTEAGAPRNGCTDMWNASMVQDAIFTYLSDIPLCPCTSKIIPVKLISYDDAKAIYKKEKSAGNLSFHVNAHIHFYCDDQKFDGKRSSIWLYPENAWEIIKHFDGIITPDFSTNADFPDPIKRYNTYRMRAFGFWISQKGLSVINNVRWGTIETWSYCFDGIPKGSIVAIGTVASNLKHLSARPDFETGLYKMVEVLEPSIIIIYGSDHYPFFDSLKRRGYKIVAFPSKTSEAFVRRGKS